MSTQLYDQNRSPANHPAVTELSISGMTCGNCARHVAQAIQNVPGVRSVNVSLDAHQATVRWAGASPEVEAVIKAVKEEGYGVKVSEETTHASPEHRLSGWRLNVWLGVPVTLTLMLGEWVFRLGMVGWFQWLAFMLASLVQVFAGARFYRGAWAQLKSGSSNMDTLVALGSTTAFAYSTWALLSSHGGHVYFMEASAIITLISLGHWIESRVTARASHALRDLLNLSPAMAWRRSPDGSERQVPVSELGIGDLVVLRPGDRVATDGIVIEGRSAVEESMLTGESVPVEKSPGHQVYAGTLNTNGQILMEVTATGQSTALAHIIEAVQHAQNSRANIQRIADRVSNFFVPVVVGIAFLSASWWGFFPESATAVHNWLRNFLNFGHLPESSAATAFIIAAAVLIIACPCAMGLATPAAIMAGSNAAARRGILIRDGIALEKAGGITAVVFDKTGTLTVGRPAVVAVWDSFIAGESMPEHAGTSHPAPSENRFATFLAASLARRSNHPVSRAVAGLAEESIEVANWSEVAGSGVEATVTNDVRTKGQTGSIARLGALHWLKGLGVDLTPGATFENSWSTRGVTVIGLALNQKLLALFALRDTLKSGAAQVISRLHHQGFKTFLVTGDNSTAAGYVASRAGIDSNAVFSEVRPQQKSEFIQELQKRGERVAFVGDGINDAPALEQADLGIAVSRASDIAREAADIILLNSEIQAVPESLALAQATLRTIKQNLFWAFFYNAAGIPLAALGFMSPILCAAAMGLSDLVVIGNALRLLRWKL